MAELWRASEHEPLAAGEWDEALAEEAIRTIVADAEAAFDGERWPFHPADDVDDSPNTIYLGVAGMAWALHELGSTGWGDPVVGALERHRRAPDGGEEWAYAPSYLGGECGIALVGYLLTRDTGLADRVHELVLANLEDEWNEMLWGAGGSLLAAEAMLAWTGEERWESAWDAVADELEASRDADGLWTQPRLDARYYGVGHGFAATSWRSGTGERSTWTPSSPVSRSATDHSPTGRPPKTRHRTGSACSGATGRRASSPASAT